MPSAAGLGAFIGYRTLKAGGAGERSRVTETGRRSVFSHKNTNNGDQYLLHRTGRGMILWRLLLAGSGVKPMKTVMLTPGDLVRRHRQEPFKDMLQTAWPTVALGYTSIASDLPWR